MHDHAPRKRWISVRTRLVVSLLLSVVIPFVLSLGWLQGDFNLFRNYELVPGVVKSLGQEKFYVMVSSTKTRYEMGFVVRPVVEYEYSYKGKVYISDRYLLLNHPEIADVLGSETRVDSISENILSKVHVGSVITVNVATSKPWMTYVEVGWYGYKKAVLPALWRGAIFIFIGAWIFLPWSYRKSK